MPRRKKLTQISVAFMYDAEDHKLTPAMEEGKAWAFRTIQTDLREWMESTIAENDLSTEEVWALRDQMNSMLDFHESRNRERRSGDQVLEVRIV